MLLSEPEIENLVATAVAYNVGSSVADQTHISEMLTTFITRSIPLGLQEPILVDGLGLPRYWATVWSSLSLGTLSYNTRLLKLRHVEDVYLFADELHGVSSLDDALGSLDVDRIAGILESFFISLRNKPTRTGQSTSLDMAMYLYFNRLTKKADAPKLRHASGAEYTENRKSWAEVYLQVAEVEDYLTTSAPTKLSDIKPLKLHNGELQPWELLFLAPKRALAEERDNGIIDITRYCAVGIPEASMLGSVLGEEKANRESLFERYGATEEDRKLTLRSHSLRHLQNTELFRLGVADTIITKRFNRRSVAQSYEYDHRSLAEELDSIELPAGVEASLGSKASTVARLIKSGNPPRYFTCFLVFKP